MSRVIFDAKRVGETRPYVFDYTSVLAVGETLTMATVTAAVYSGTDPTISPFLNGAPAVVTPKVTQSITAGLVGVTYKLDCAATTSLGNVFVITAFLTIIPNVT